MNAKTLIQSKVFWTSLATIFTGIGLFFSGEKELQELIIIVVGTIFGALRVITEKPISGLK